METDSYLLKIMDGESLTRSEAQGLMDTMVLSDTTDAKRAAFLSCLFFRDITPEEIIGFSESLRSQASASRIPGLTDIVGTGGDGRNTINVSTGASITTSALGIKIAKHGNVGITSKHGSADFMKYIGYDFERSLNDPVHTLESENFLYAFAPRFNNSFARFSNVRKKIGHRTIFNFMGPITNPFDPDFIVIGTADEALTSTYAEVIRRRGKKGFVLHSEDGLDEISPSAKTTGFLVNGGITEIEVVPEEIAGVKIDLKTVIHEEPEECFISTYRGLSGKDRNAMSFIAMNAAPAIMLNGLASSLRDGYEVARNAIEDGAVIKHLSKISQGRGELNEVS